jgi:hypothetical protein
MYILYLYIYAYIYHQVRDKNNDGSNNSNNHSLNSSDSNNNTDTIEVSTKKDTYEVLTFVKKNVQKIYPQNKKVLYSNGLKS